MGLACLTTAIGLRATAHHVERVTMRRVSYRVGLIIVVVAALLICNLGLTNIIALASPILSVVCLLFMTTVVLLLFRKHLRSTWVFKGAALAAVAASLLLTVHDLTGAFAFVEAAPLYAYGFPRGSCRQWSAARRVPFWAGGSIRPRADQSSQKLINCTITITFLIEYCR